ncbi:MAG: hypothetical protein LBJ21_00540, partial [Acidobacteriota bacterium]|nr:hypothetical protein [Acidobacteriota bacterium]
FLTYTTSSKKHLSYFRPRRKQELFQKAFEALLPQKQHSYLIKITTILDLSRIDVHVRSAFSESQQNKDSPLTCYTLPPVCESTIPARLQQIALFTMGLPTTA